MRVLIAFYHEEKYNVLLKKICTTLCREGKKNHFPLPLMILHSPSISSKITHFSPTRFSYKPLCRDIKPGTAPHGTSKLARRKSLFILLSATREKAGDCVCVRCVWRRAGIAGLPRTRTPYCVYIVLFYGIAKKWPKDTERD